jgi:hypothetical protein
MTCATNDSEIFHILRSHVGNHEMASDSKLLGIDRSTFMRLARGDGPSQAGSLLQSSLPGSPLPLLNMMTSSGGIRATTPAPPMSPHSHLPRPHSNYHRSSSIVSNSSIIPITPTTLHHNLSNNSNSNSSGRAASSNSPFHSYITRANSSSSGSGGSPSASSSSHHHPHPPHTAPTPPTSYASPRSFPSRTPPVTTPSSSSRLDLLSPSSISFLARSGPSTVSGSSMSSSHGATTPVNSYIQLSGTGTSSQHSTPRIGATISSSSSAHPPPHHHHHHHLTLTPSNRSTGSSTPSSHGPPSPLLSPPIATHATRRSFSD